jgi:hypothetical protein
MNTSENIRIAIEPYVEQNPCIIRSPVPRIVFIVPYRNREQQQMFFARHMQYILSDLPPYTYEIYYAHQKDTRDFNRGAMRNIGFLAIKAKYPYHYKNITFVFNDVDTMPYSKNFLDYDTEIGVIKHPYGFTHTLGGIVSIKGCDYEKTNGYPNYWAWGYEDNLFQTRVLTNQMKIDRSVFYPVGDKNIMQLQDGMSRIVNPAEYKRYMHSTNNDGLTAITDLEYTIDPTTGFIDITNFNIPNPNIYSLNKTHELTSGSRPFVGKRGATMKLAI